MALQGRNRNETFVELFTLHQRDVYRFIFSLVSNQADTEDILQQTSLVLWRKFHTFDLESDFLAWACRIAYLEALNFLKQKRRSRVVFSDELVARLAEIRETRTEVHAADRTALRDCIKMLAEADRHLIVLCYGKKRNIKAAAEELDRPVASVYNSLVRVRRVLMRCVRRGVMEEGDR